VSSEINYVSKRTTDMLSILYEFNGVLQYRSNIPTKFSEDQWNGKIQGNDN